MNALGEDIDTTVITGKVIRPLRSVDPSQSEYQGLIEVIEEGRCLNADGKMLLTALSKWVNHSAFVFYFQGEVKARKYPLES